MRAFRVTYATCVTYATMVPVASALALGLVIVFSDTAAPAATGLAAGRITGPAKVIDGDTLDIDGIRIRLEGIDAPESGQRCKRRWLGTWNCGEAATKALIRLVAGGDISCESRGRDVYRRLLAVCHAGGEDINARLVRDGLAWAFVKYSQSYVGVETEARAARRGIFSADNQPAWDYRAQAWQGAEQKAPEGCAIKGNVSGKGRIYHMPWSPWYSRVSIDAERGERWFCSESEALAAGWRPVQGS